MQNFLLDLGLQWELQLDFCTWDNGWCYHGVICSDSLSKSCVHNSASEDICLRHCNIQDRLNTSVRWTPLSEIDEKNQRRSLKFGTFLSTLVSIVFAGSFHFSCTSFSLMEKPLHKNCPSYCHIFTQKGTFQFTSLQLEF